MKTTVTGQLNLVDETVNETLVPLQFPKIFPSLSGLIPAGWQRGVINSTTNGGSPVALDFGDVDQVKLFVLYIESGNGSITMKHDSNTNGIVIDSGIVLQGKIADVTIETTSTENLTYRWLATGLD